jgi:integrase
MKGWQIDQKAALNRLHPALRRGSLGHDAEGYLARPDVQAMPSYNMRAFHIGLWVEAFGANLSRDRITVPSINAVLERWRAAGLSGGTVNRRRTSLMALYTALDGRSAPNPVRDSTHYPEAEPRHRGLSWPVVEAILAALPKPLSATSARIWVMATTGVPPKTLASMKPDRLKLDEGQHGTMALPRRLKGRTVDGRIVPLTADAQLAWAAFIAADAWGPFSVSSCAKGFKVAARKVGLTGVRLYDLRHSFARLVYERTQGNLQAVAGFLQHADPRTTARYVNAGVPTMLGEVARTLSSDTPLQVVGPTQDTVH